jgi:hypothetical protein
MHKQRIYIDTSVIGGCFDKEFAKWSKLLINEILDGYKIAVISDITIREIEKAPKQVNDLFEKMLQTNIELIEIDDDMEALSAKYIENKAISGKFKDDSLHIAAATIRNVDALVSWNFKHIVNNLRIKKYNSVNLFNGYNLIDIRTPMEVLNEDENY